MAEEFDDEQERMVQIPGAELKRLKKESKEGRAALAEREAAQRELAFYKAGVDLDHPVANYFVKAYDGEISADAVRAEWAKLTGQQTTGQQDAAAQEVAAMQEASDLVSGVADIPLDKLAERNAKLAGLSATDPRLSEKFDSIMAEYGTPVGKLYR